MPRPGVGGDRARLPTHFRHATRTCKTGRVLDERWIRSLHVQSLRRHDVHPEHDDHVIFQASTIGALLDGAYEGDLTFAELAEHGDTAIGTLNHLDGELIAIDGEFLRADADGAIHAIPGDARTPFAVAVWFTPEIETELPAQSTFEALGELIGEHLPEGDSTCAIRIDGEFEMLRGRSGPSQSPPYCPLDEVIAACHVFELHEVRGTMVGFRFPDHGDGIEIDGYHLHFVTADRERGGHVLDFRIGPGPARAGIDLESGLEVELPPGVELNAPHLEEELRTALASIKHRRE